MEIPSNARRALRQAQGKLPEAPTGVLKHVEEAEGAQRGS